MSTALPSSEPSLRPKLVMWKVVGMAVGHELVIGKVLSRIDQFPHIVLTSAVLSIVGGGSLHALPYHITAHVIRVKHSHLHSCLWAATHATLALCGLCLIE